jgi:hypothetical protein
MFNAMMKFGSVYVSDDLWEALEIISAVLPKAEKAALTFRPSGYDTTVERHAKGSKVTVTLVADWARGSARRDLTAEQIADMTTTLTGFGRTVWVDIGDGPITLRRPST